MKLHTRKMKHLSLLLAVPLILVACSNEDEPVEDAAIEDEEVEAEDVTGESESMDAAEESEEEETDDYSPTGGKIYDDQDDADDNQNESSTEESSEDADDKEKAFEDMTEMEKAYAKAEDEQEKKEEARSKLDDENMVNVGNDDEILVDTEPSMDYIKISPSLENPMLRFNTIDGEYPSEDEFEVKALSRGVLEHHVHPVTHVSVPVYYPHAEDYVIESMTESEDGESMVSVASGTMYIPVDENDKGLYPSYAAFDFSVELEHFEFDTIPLSITIEGEEFKFTNTY